MRLSLIGFEVEWAGLSVEGLVCFYAPAECSNGRRSQREEPERPEPGSIARMDQPPGLCSSLTGRSAPCGAEVSTGQPTMRLAIISTTGIPVELTIPRGETVEGLRTHLSRRLRLQTDKIVLVHKHR